MDDIQLLAANNRLSMQVGYQTQARCRDCGSIAASFDAWTQSSSTDEARRCSNSNSSGSCCSKSQHQEQMQQLALLRAKRLRCPGSGVGVGLCRRQEPGMGVRYVMAAFGGSDARGAGCAGVRVVNHVVAARRRMAVSLQVGCASLFVNIVFFWGR
ncbi:hypothetical protein DFJ73DRAFT_787744 [Zopfochytrium polystomum]|nr:hypothetical protein DFJ73DRAFT_787744 [Zopfochytrium polystomum]